jgi:hypothetical protein
MKKLTYLQVYKDAGLYKEWLLENFFYFSQRYFKLEKHIKAISKLTKISFEDIEKDLFEEYNNL